MSSTDQSPKNAVVTWIDKAGTLRSAQTHVVWLLNAEGSDFYEIGVAAGVYGEPLRGEAAMDEVETFMELALDSERSRDETREQRNDG